MSFFKRPKRLPFQLKQWKWWLISMFYSFSSFASSFLFFFACLQRFTCEQMTGNNLTDPSNEITNNWLKFMEKWLYQMFTLWLFSLRMSDEMFIKRTLEQSLVIFSSKKKKQNKTNIRDCTISFRNIKILKKLLKDNKERLLKLCWVLMWSLIVSSSQTKFICLFEFPVREALLSYQEPESDLTSI